MPFRRQAAFFWFAIGLMTGCGKSPDAAKDVPDTPSASLVVSLARAETHTIERTVIVSGPVSAWEEMQLGVELSGLRITALKVDVGQAVKQGQVLLQLDHRQLDSELSQAQAAYAEAEAGVALAQTNFKRGQTLAESRMISASALDELRAAQVQAQAHLATARAQRDNAQLRRQFADLRAPDDGIIAKRLVQPGQIATAGAELLRLIRQGRLEWRAELAPGDLPKVRPGAQAWISGPDGLIEGRVRAVTPGLDAATRTGTAYVDLPRPGALRAGVFVQGRIVASTAQALTVPAASLVRRDGYAYVFIVDDNNIVHRQRVRIGAGDGGRTEILEGLKPGTAVVARGAGFLSDGDRVRVVASEGDAAP